MHASKCFHLTRETGFCQDFHKIILEGVAVSAACLCMHDPPRVMFGDGEVGLRNWPECSTPQLCCKPGSRSMNGPPWTMDESSG